MFAIRTKTPESRRDGYLFSGTCLRLCSTHPKQPMRATCTATLMNLGIKRLRTPSVRDCQRASLRANRAHINDAAVSRSLRERQSVSREGVN